MWLICWWDLSTHCLVLPQRQCLHLPHLWHLETCSFPAARREIPLQTSCENNKLFENCPVSPVHLPSPPRITVRAACVFWFWDLLPFRNTTDKFSLTVPGAWIRPWISCCCGLTLDRSWQLNRIPAKGESGTWCGLGSVSHLLGRPDSVFCWAESRDFHQDFYITEQPTFVHFLFSPSNTFAPSFKTMPLAYELPHLGLEGVHQSAALHLLCALYEDVAPFSSFTFPMDPSLESCGGNVIAFNKSHPHFEAALGLRLQGKSLNLIAAKSLRSFGKNLVIWGGKCI